MTTPGWPILTATLVSAAEFVRFWDRLYAGYDEAFYRDNIGRRLTPGLVEQWFTWKNGRPLSAGKKQSVRRHFPTDERIDPDAGPEDLAAFLCQSGGAIWRIFWLHLLHPERFPIYDQHVHRAMTYILGWADREALADDPAKVRAYLNDYRPFFERWAAGLDRRQLDRALWSFGKFLKTGYGRAVFRANNRASTS